MGIGDFFKSKLGKQVCALCGNECGVMHRTKIKGDDFVCNECKRKCRKFIRLSDYTKEELEEHIRYMERQEKLYQTCFADGKRDTYPSAFRKQALSFVDEVGMFEIMDRDTSERKLYHELFRYDQILSYEPYVEHDKPTEPGKPEVFKESGVKLRLAGARDHVQLDQASTNRGIHTHPYVRQEIKVVFHTSENETDYTKSAIAHLNHIFGVHDDERGLFQIGMTTAEKRNLKAGVAAFKTAKEALSMAKSGAEGLTEEKAAELQGNLNAMSDAQTGGLAEYTRRADAAEDKAWNA